MSIFGKTLKILLDVAEMPVAVVKDVVTLGGVLDDKSEPHIVSKVKDIAEDYDELKDEATKL